MKVKIIKNNGVEDGCGDIFAEIDGRPCHVLSRCGGWYGEWDGTRRSITRSEEIAEIELKHGRRLSRVDARGYHYFVGPDGREVAMGFRGYTSESLTPDQVDAVVAAAFPIRWCRGAQEDATHSGLDSCRGFE